MNRGVSMKKFFISLLVIFSITNIVFAQGDEWLDKNYNFKSIKTVLLFPITYNQGVSSISQRNIEDITAEKLKLNNVKLITMNDISTLMMAKGLDLNNFESFKEVVKQNTDAVLQINVIGYGMSSEYVEGTVIPYQTTNTSYINTSYGSSASITTPQTSYIPIAGGKFPVAFSYVHFTLYDSDNGMPILEKQDFRDKMNRLIIDNTTPKDLYKRILGSFSSLLNSKMN